MVVQFAETTLQQWHGLLLLSVCILDGNTNSHHMLKQNKRGWLKLCPVVCYETLTVSHQYKCRPNQPGCRWAYNVYKMVFKNITCAVKLYEYNRPPIYFDRWHTKRILQYIIIYEYWSITPLSVSPLCCVRPLVSAMCTESILRTVYFRVMRARN